MREHLKLCGLFIVTAALDHFLHKGITSGVILADPVTVLAVAATVTAATAVTTGALNYMASQDARSAANSLKNEQAAQLAAEQERSRADAAAAATSGQTFGGPRETATTGFGFGSGNAGPANSGRGQLTGMG